MEAGSCNTTCNLQDNPDDGVTMSRIRRKQEKESFCERRKISSSMGEWMGVMEHLIWLISFVLILSPLSSLSPLPLSDEAPVSCPSPENGRIFLWKVRGPSLQRPSYLFGTIHVRYTKVWPSVARKVRRALESAGQVMFELNLLDPRTISDLTECQMLPRGQRLRDIVPKSVHRRLRKHLDYIKEQMPQWVSTTTGQNRQLYAEYLFNMMTSNWERKRPIWIIVMVNSLTEQDIRSRGVPVLDMFLAQEAKRLNKKTGALETVEDQCQPLNQLNMTQAVFALNHTLAQHEDIRERHLTTTLSTDDLVRQYVCGDIKTDLFGEGLTSSSRSVTTPKNDSTETALSSLLPSVTTNVSNQITEEIDKYFRTELISRRNERMGHKIVDLLRQHPETSYFFALGTAHFLGPQSIIRVLKEEGFRVDRISKYPKVAKRRKNNNDNDRRHLNDWKPPKEV